LRRSDLRSAIVEHDEGMRNQALRDERGGRIEIRILIVERKSWVIASVERASGRREEEGREEVEVASLSADLSNIHSD
jgi:hypothetical protein